LVQCKCWYSSQACLQLRQLASTSRRLACPRGMRAIRSTDEFCVETVQFRWCSRSRLHPLHATYNMVDTVCFCASRSLYGSISVCVSLHPCMVSSMKTGGMSPGCLALQRCRSVRLHPYARHPHTTQKCQKYLQIILTKVRKEPFIFNQALVSRKIPLVKPRSQSQPN